MEEELQMLMNPQVVEEIRENLKEFKERKGRFLFCKIEKFI